MVFKIENKCLNQIREVLCNPINEVYVCEDMNSTYASYYTLWKIKDHTMAKEILKALHKNMENSICIDSFAGKNFMGFLLPFEKERPIYRFYAGKIRSEDEKQKVYIDFIKVCMTQNIPPAILYLLLYQKQIHMQADFSIHFSYFLDFSEFDSNKNEKDCVNLCAGILLELMKEEVSKKNLTESLIKKRMEKKGYENFTQLYKDVKLSSKKNSKNGFMRKIVKSVYKWKDYIFRVLLILLFIMIILAIIMIISQIIFGEIPFFRLFQDCFEKIGTESLLQ